MDKKDDLEFVRILTGMCEIYDRKCSAAFIELYRSALDQVSIKDFRVAANKAVRTLKFFPKPAEILELCGSNRSFEEKAEREAYGVIEQIRSVGSYGTPRFSDPVTTVVMTKRFRWRDVCMTPEKELKWFIREFVEAYKSYQGRPEVEHTNKPPAKLIELASKIGSA